MPHDVTSKHLTKNVIPLIMVIDVSIKIVDAFGAGAIDYEAARVADMETARA